MARISFIGGGNMAEALIKGLLAAKLYKTGEIFASDIKAECLDYLARAYGVVKCRTNAEAADKADVVVLSIKPQNMAEALASVKDALKPETLVLSIVAGKKVATISQAVGEKAVVRAMPNTPALIGQGATALFANEKAKPRLKEAEQIFLAVGRVVVVESEDLMDAVTAVSGSGPAYYFLLMEEMIKSAQELGLSADAARTLVLQTAKGAALLAEEASKKGETPAELRQKVTSPGGTTEAAIKSLTESEFGKIVKNAIAKACRRSSELSK